MNPVLKGSAGGQAVEGKNMIFFFREKMHSVFAVEDECIFY